jgi:hypothetical protein
MYQISSFISDYVSSISCSIRKSESAYSLTKCQIYWLSFCLMGMLLSNELNWSKYSRLSMHGYKIGALSWMFRHSKINFELLFRKSMLHVLSVYGIKGGHIVFDDTDRERSKNALLLHGLGKQKDKKSGGYFLGQNILFMVLVTEKVTLPIGFAFYQNDPQWLLWKKEEDRLAKKGVKKAFRPIEVLRDEVAYPTKQQLCMQLLADFKTHFPDITIQSIMADCFFGTKSWTQGMLSSYPKAQIISQLKSNQLITYQNKQHKISEYFGKRAAIKSQTVVRGGKKVVIYYSSLIARVDAHHSKRLIIAYKYEGEAEFRYVFATNMSWMPHHVIATYTFRWLVEVFISDWKRFEAWAVLTKHTGVEGANHSLLLSLLLDHCLLLHPEQQARIHNNLPAATVGSLREKSIQQHLFNSIEYILNQPNPKELFKELVDNMQRYYLLRDSTKHASGAKMPYQAKAA